MNLEIDHYADAVLVSVDDSRIDASVAIQFKDSMRALTSGGPKRVILNMEKVDFLDSSGLGAVVAAMKQLDADQSLELAGLTENVAKVFRLTRLDAVFTIHQNASDAVAGLADV